MADIQSSEHNEVEHGKLVLPSDAPLEDAFKMEILHSPELVAWTQTVDARLTALNSKVDKIVGFIDGLAEGLEGMSGLMESLAPMLEGLGAMAGGGAFSDLPVPQGFGG